MTIENTIVDTLLDRARRAQERAAMSIASAELAAVAALGHVLRHVLPAAHRVELEWDHGAERWFFREVYDQEGNALGRPAETPEWFEVEDYADQAMLVLTRNVAGDHSDDGERVVLDLRP